MENKINIVELLKDCPKGIELYSPLCGECRVINIYYGLGFDVICADNTVYNFSYDGRYNMMGECVIFPSKENRDWSKFQRPFMDGDVVAGENCACSYITIFKKFLGGIPFKYHVCLTDYGEFKINSQADNANLRFATEEEKIKLFDAIKANGYKWNSETKTLEKLIKPKFKVGDRIKKKGDYISGIITCIDIDNFYKVEYDKGGISYINSEAQDNYELVPNKFDINTLKPFESKVLVKSSYNDIWRPAIYGFTDSRKYYIIGGIYWEQCIPYEGNEHLLGTTNDCDEYFKTWEI